MMQVVYMDVSENSGTPKSSILVGFSILNHPFWGSPIFGNTHMFAPFSANSVAELLTPSVLSFTTSKDFSARPISRADLVHQKKGRRGDQRQQFDLNTNFPK